jgi:alpha-tubulin suppressor-like RCC1 family protein
MNRLSKLVFSLVATVGFCSAQVVHATSATAITVGNDHTCAVTGVGGVECWGLSNYGQLGNGTTTNSVVRGNVTGLGSGSGVIAISAGGLHTCALTGSAGSPGGGVECWGYNYEGELGNGTTTTSSPYGVLTPVNVTGLGSGVIAISAGDKSTCALTSAGGVECWGYNGYGALGNGTTTDSHVPVNVTGLSSGVIAISAGGFGHACALTSAGGVECWGNNNYGQLGNGTTSNSDVPVNVTGLSSGVIAIAAGYAHTCALIGSVSSPGGGVECWGNNYNGQLGNGTTTDSDVPVNVTGLSSGVIALAAGGGYGHACVLTSAGGVECWGYNADGELGNGTTTESHVPVNVMGLSSRVSKIAVGYGRTCALTSAGGVECWGGGSLGNGTTTNSSVPVHVIGFGPVKSDFDGDSLSDVLFLNTTAYNTRYWPHADKTQTVYPGTYNTNYIYLGEGDFDGDGTADILFMNTSSRATIIWPGAVKASATYPGTIAAGFDNASIGDFDGDGKDDIFWSNPTTGITRIWWDAVKSSVTYPGSQSTAYAIAASADFDGDGKADVFWRNGTTGQDVIWLSGKKSTRLYPGNVTDLTWMAFGAGDVDDDGKSDLVWYNTSSGATRVWLSGTNGSVTYPGVGPSGFTPQAIADYDGDGKADLLWSDGSTTRIWRGVVKTAVTYPGTSPAGFTIQK